MINVDHWVHFAIPNQKSNIFSIYFCNIKWANIIGVKLPTLSLLTSYVLP